MKKALIPIFLAFILLSGSVGVVEAASLTPSQISAIVGLLRSFGADEGIIANVNLTLVGTTEPSGDKAWCHTFNTNLGIDSRGDEVQALHTVLVKEGFDISDSEQPQKDGETSYGHIFGESTASAVTGFQEKYRSEILTPLGLKYGTGYVGKSTRAKLNQLYGCGVITPKPEGAGYLEIEPSSASIAVGESKSFQAFYQPPMPKCPEGFACPQVMPARFPVVAEWTSSNPSVASIDIIGSCAAIGCPVPTNVLIKGISNGTADIKAAYKSPSGSILTATAKVTVGSGSLAPSITVLSPNGGENWAKGESRDIGWSSLSSYINIELLSWTPPCDSKLLICPAMPSFSYTIAENVLAGGKGFTPWKVGTDINGKDIPIGSYVIRIYDPSNGRFYDQSDAPFSIVTGTGSTNTAPKINGIPAIPSSIQPWQSVSFSWNATDADRDNLSWSVNWGDGTGSVDACDIPTSNLTVGTNSGTNFTAFHSWSQAGTYKIQVSVSDCKGGSDTNTFNVTVGLVSSVPSITVTYPNGGEALTKGQSYFIRWAQTGFASDGWIQLQLRDAVNSSTMVKLIASSVPLGAYAGSFNWTIPTDIPDGKYLIWATAGSGLDSLGTRVVGSDFSDVPFTISTTPGNAADASSGGGSSFAALLFSLERQLEELERLLNSLLP